mmetsp:Transcript_41715/g.126571  ORF Transcript_41715/g.126571 Transcript_41715/m.126571 type:complete len:224 (+) Transcript_41715:680-1351(+)
MHSETSRHSVQKLSLQSVQNATNVHLLQRLRRHPEHQSTLVHDSQNTALHRSHSPVVGQLPTPQLVDLQEAQKLLLASFSKQLSGIFSANATKQWSHFILSISIWSALIVWKLSSQDWRVALKLPRPLLSLFCARKRTTDKPRIDFVQFWRGSSISLTRTVKGGMDERIDRMDSSSNPVSPGMQWSVEPSLRSISSSARDPLKGSNPSPVTAVQPRRERLRVT